MATKTGRYGQLDSDKVSGFTMGDRIRDNQIVEGDVVANIRMMYKTGLWQSLQKYTDGLKGIGWSDERIDSMVRRATFDGHFS